ncbi:immunity 49 family protein [Kitasatospora sp. NPDC088391]|uniref:immunity 49 family protein n=1 Tax=Kitasatospora sp. NPDC088391 TaxID=3364074 RepID=UPI0037F8075D
MTVTVARHIEPEPNSQAIAKDLAEQVGTFVDLLEGSAEIIDILFDNARLSMNMHCRVDPEAARLETWEATVTALQVGSALFAVTAAEEGTVDCFINGRMRSIPAMGPRTYAGARNWLDAFYLAMVCRDQERARKLCEIPVERLRVREGVYEFLYAWIDALQSYWLQRPDLLDKLEIAFEASYPDAADPAASEAINLLFYPPLHLFYQVLRKREEEFGPALVEALEFHKRFWTETEKRATDTRGAIALGPLAMACHAFDGKFPLGVESPYLPKYLLNHEWLGEFPT